MEEKDVKIEEVSITENANTPNGPTSNKKTETDTTEIETLNNQLAELQDKYLRLAAELENTRRRAAIDAESSAKNRAMSVAQKFLPVMDAIQSALNHNPNDEGIKSMALAMENAFAQIGITKIESVGQTLNPKLHNAIQVIESPNNADQKTQPNTIVEEMQTGYMFGDTVLRTAMVVVSK